jgi:hypothetical protein
MPSGTTCHFLISLSLSLFIVFTDEELEALLDRSDMLSVSSDTEIETKRKDRVKHYKVVDQQCGDSKLKQFC